MTAPAAPIRLHRHPPRDMPSPFHEGERLVQHRAGVRERMEKIGRIVFRDFMPDEHRELFAKLPYLLAGSLDERGSPWASVLTGLPGFVSSPDPCALRVNARPACGDPLARNLAVGAPSACSASNFQPAAAIA